MKIKTTKKNPIKIIALVAVIVLLLLAGWLYYAHHFQKWPFLPVAVTSNSSDKVDYKVPSNEQTAAGATVKQQVADQAKADSKTTSQTQQPSNVAIDITASNKTSSTLIVRTLIQSVTSSGTCTLTMAGPSGGAYTATASVQAMASTSTCKGFDVPLAGLAHGQWQVKINFTDGQNTGTTSKDVTL